MPGVTGFFDPAADREKGRDVLKKMSNTLYHYPFYERDDLFIHDNIYASRVHNNVIQNGSQPIINGQICVWMDGEIYHTTKHGADGAKKNDAYQLSTLYLENQDFGFLKDMDSIFSAVIYDQRQQQIHFLTDRYGLKFLYYFQDGDKLAWASEPKAILALDGFEARINQDAVHSFFANTYLTGQQSWFENLELFPPASIFTWDLNRKTFIRKQRYWSWEKIKPLSKQTKTHDIVEELGSLFRKAVEKRVAVEENIGVTLSGGLDSRAILAGMPKSEKKMHAFTYGKPGCSDIQLAKQVSEVDGITHHEVPITPENWLENRAEAVWLTDGQMSLIHMHALVFFPEIVNYFNINLNGYLGDAILGGSYLTKKGTLIENVNNRGRRLINESIRLKEILGLHNRLPFFDYALMEFVLSIPKRLRKDSYIYNKMLSNEFPAYYDTISWGKTGFSISTTKPGMLLKRKIMGRLRYTFFQIQKMCGRDYYEHKRFPHNYPNWFRRSSVFIENILKNPEAIYPEFISRDQALKTWQTHLNGADNLHKISAYLTFELYLQQVFENKFRPTVESLRK